MSLNLGCYQSAILTQGPRCHLAAVSTDWDTLALVLSRHMALKQASSGGQLGADVFLSLAPKVWACTLADESSPNTACCQVEASSTCHTELRRAASRLFH